MKAPFPWFGGKRRQADAVWRALGRDVPNYVEPFAGSLAVLLGRPGGAGKIETVNDLNCDIANFWRAIAANPDAVAEWANWPVNEADMHARNSWLVSEVQAHRERMHTDAEYYDEKRAGWWVWGQCIWIGSGWCGEPGVSVQHGRPRPNLRDQGINSGLPSLGNDRGINGVAAAPCAEWFSALQCRLRRTRVACGDWRRVLTPSVLGKGKNVGGRMPVAVFLDPPYSHAHRDARIYNDDDGALSGQVREWALAHGDDPDLRIALCGYEGEHTMPSSWAVHAWKAARGYAGASNNNRELERIWFSPHCLPLNAQRGLFEVRP